MILVVLGEGTRVRVSMRCDLSLTPDGDPKDDLLGVIAELGPIVGRQCPTAVVGVIADHRFAPTDIRYRRVLTLLDASLSDWGGLAQGFVVSAFHEHAPWRLAWHSGHFATATGLGDGVDAGVMDDPRTSPTAVAAAVSVGRRILDDRCEIAEMLAPLPHCISAICSAARNDSYSSPQQRRDDSAYLLAALLDAMDDPTRADCTTISLLERAITTIPVRDAALACAVTDLRPDAETLWRVLTRRLRGCGRASAATLLAHLHYIGGDGAYAGIALDCALEADPDWRLAGLLDKALRGGAQPSLLWRMIDDSLEIAADLGITLPRVTLGAVG